MNKLWLLFFVAACNLISASEHKYVEIWEGKGSPHPLIRDWIGQGEYLSPVFTRWIPKDQVSLILEIGSRDVIDALDLSDYYKAHVFAFECNPEAIEICKHNKGNNPNITLVPFAVWNETTPLKFFPVIPGGQVVCIGASSLFKFDPNGPVQRTQLQGEVTVQAIRMDEWLEHENIENVDLVCIDAQGATLQVLQGFGEKLSHVKYIIAEAEYRPYYIGEALYAEIYTFLFSKGFTQVAKIDHDLYADVLFIRNDLIH